MRCLGCQPEDALAQIQCKVRGKWIDYSDSPWTILALGWAGGFFVGVGCAFQFMRIAG